MFRAPGNGHSFETSVSPQATAATINPRARPAAAFAAWPGELPIDVGDAARRRRSFVPAPHKPESDPGSAAIAVVRQALEPTTASVAKRSSGVGTANASSVAKALARLEGHGMRGAIMRTNNDGQAVCANLQASPRATSNGCVYQSVRVGRG